MRAVSRFVLGLSLLAFAAGSAWPHDASSYGGVFRSRNFGGTWLRANVGLFLNAPLIVAVDPRNPSHLLAGTDFGLIVSHNGGLTWAPEARDLIFGAAFAVIFLDGGERAICAAQSGVFRFEDGRWTAARAPEAAIPARMLRSEPRPIRSICSAEAGCSPAATARGRFQRCAERPTRGR